MTDPADPPRIRIVVADDHPVVREGLRSFLATRPGLEVVGDAADADSLVRLTEDLHPDVALVDLFMPGDGIEAIRRLTELTDPPRSLVLTSFGGDDKVVPALRAGAAGYLLKDVDPLELEAAVRTVHGGGTLLGPLAADALAGVVRDHPETGVSASPETSEAPQSERPHDGDERLTELTPREREVLACLAEGLSNKTIAARLYVSEKTVKTHVSMILSKLRVADRTQAAVYALRHGIGR